MNDVSVNNQKRRTFLGVFLAGIVTALGAVFAWPVFRFLAPREQTGASDLVRIARKDVPIGGAHFFSFQGRPAVLLQPTPGSFVALTAVCTHLGCIVKWVDDKGEFLCPCHGGRFSAEGKVLGGPPPLPLEAYTVALEEQDLVVGRAV